MSEQDGPKQKKSKIPVSREARRAAKKPLEAVPVTVNERQIATGTLSTTGERGADIIARISDWLQANGKVVVGVMALVVVAFLVVLVMTRTSSGQENRFQAMLVAAENEQKHKDLLEAFDKIVVEAEKSPASLAEYNYRLATSLWSLMLPKTREGKPFEDGTLDRLTKAVEGYKGAAEVDPAKTERTQRLDFILAKAKDWDSFIRSDASRVFADSEYKSTDAAPKIVGDDEYPVALFETTRGPVRMQLFDEAAIRNSISMVVTLIERGYYQGLVPEIVRGPGTASLDDALLSNTSFVAVGRRGKLHDLPNPDDKDKKFTEEELKERAKKKDIEPFFSIMPETSSRWNNDAGTVMLYTESHTAGRRGAFLGFNTGDNPGFDGKFQVVGKVADEASLKTLRQLTKTDRFVSARMESKRKRDYTPLVVFIRGPQVANLPTLWLEETKALEPVRIPKSDAVINETANPRVVISTSKGDVEVELEEDICPNTVANFLYLVKKDGYKGSVFHRILGAETGPDDTNPRIVQGGRDPAMIKEATELKDQAKAKRDLAARSATADAKKLEDEAKSLESRAESLYEKHGWTIKHEGVDNPKYTLRNTVGSICMARTGESFDTAGRQFYINLRPNPTWDKKDNPYTVFGRVTKNLWILEDIRENDKIEEVWVVNKRRESYVPTVKFTGELSYRPAE